MSDTFISEINYEARRGNASLWLGDGSAALAKESTRLLDYPWLAVWQEDRASALANAMRLRWNADETGRFNSRLVCEVPLRLEDSLGTYYSFSELCPFFYLNGRDAQWESLSARDQRRARDEKVDQLSRLNSTIVLVSGIVDPKALLSKALDEWSSAPDEMIFVLCGLDRAAQESLVELLAKKKPDFIARVRLTDLSADDLLSQAAPQTTVSDEPSIIVGEQAIPLRPLLSRDPPLDQYFEVISNLHISPRRDDEKTSDLLEVLISGRMPPWRSLSVGMQWKRNAIRLNRITKEIDDFRARKDATHVLCVTIAAEHGAGLTTLLQEASVACAKRGLPTFWHRQSIEEVDYDAIRHFFEALDSRTQGAALPVLVFDGQDALEPMSDFRQLGARFAKDGRRAVIIRGVSVASAKQVSDDFIHNASFNSDKSRVREYWLREPLEARLQIEERSSLCAWAKAHLSADVTERLESTIATWGSTWSPESDDAPPLLICLFFILYGQLRAATDIGKHIVDRIRRVIPDAPNRNIDDAVPSTTPAPPAVLSAAELKDAILKLQRRFNRTFTDGPRKDEAVFHDLDLAPTAEHYCSIIGILSAFGALKIPVPRRVLARLSNARDRTLDAVTSLTRVDIVTATLLSDGGFQAPSAFYDSAEHVGFTHPSFGRLLLEWLRTDSGAKDLELLSHGTLVQELVSALGDRVFGPYPIQLLGPVFARLTPTQDEVRFVAEISARLLRLQRIGGSPYHDWLYKDRKQSLVLDLIAKIPEQVARQSSVVLHTRGISLYKSCAALSGDLEQCRLRYGKAASDFDLALDIAKKEPRGENPVTLLTSKGLMYLNWAELERRHSKGDLALAESAEANAEDALRESISLRPDDGYASYGLAEFLVKKCERFQGKELTTEQSLGYGLAISEACQLLQIDPSDSFRDEWERLWVRLRVLLSSQEADQSIQRIVDSNDEFGLALRALVALRGRIPTEPTLDPGEQVELASAEAIINARNPQMKPSHLACLLRYAIFSANPARLNQPDYEERFRLLEKLRETTYLRIPIWLFDFGMLAFQTGRYTDGVNAFRDLRKGRKFFQVPRERAVYWAQQAEPNKRQTAILRVLRLEPKDNNGWGRIDSPMGIEDPVPFQYEASSRKKNEYRVGGTFTCHIRIRPSGLFAERLS